MGVGGGESDRFRGIGVGGYVVAHVTDRFLAVQHTGNCCRRVIVCHVMRAAAVSEAVSWLTTGVCVAVPVLWWVVAGCCGGGARTTEWKAAGAVAGSGITVCM
jgi:hypothetical protein